MILGPLFIFASLVIAWFVFTGVFQRAFTGTPAPGAAHG